jgi:hypothetical protein
VVDHRYLGRFAAGHGCQVSQSRPVPL